MKIVFNLQKPQTKHQNWNQLDWIEQTVKGLMGLL